MGRLVVALLLFVCACARAVEVPAPTSFFMVGEVRDVREGVEPIGVPQDEGLDDEGSPDEGGEFAVRPRTDEGLERCRREGSVHTVFYTPATNFDPARTVADRRFPQRLQNTRVTVIGLVYALDVADEIGGCTLVAQRVDVRQR